MGDADRGGVLKSSDIHIAIGGVLNSDQKCGWMAGAFPHIVLFLSHS